MARPTGSITTFLSLLLLPALLLISAGPPVSGRSVPTLERDDAAGGLQTYIVHVTPPAGVVFSSSEDRHQWHSSFLPTTDDTNSDASGRMVYSYGNVISGFSARLSREELQAMAAKEGFLHANPDRVLHLQTTHTTEFLGLHLRDGFLRGSNLGRGVIVGVLDTGIFPDHPSFSDAGMPPPPAKWKGRCDFGTSLCNNKLIGARSFTDGRAGSSTPPVDDEGHGTHTASTAAGQFVKGAEVLGQALGTAAGMAPRAHLAIYKVCSTQGCAVSNILAAMDAAVEDGVDVLSLSLGGPSQPFYADDLAIGAFGAIEKGVFVSCAAGNGGPMPSTLSNEAPWILTVAASTMDRSIRSSVKLANGTVLNGESLFQPKDFPSTPLPLVDAGSGKAGTAFCGEGTLDGLDVKGKAVLCERGGGIARIAKGQTVKDAGGAAMILMNQVQDGYSTLADAHVLPASHIGYTDGSTVRTAIATSANATASFAFEGTLLGTGPAPAITSFSSRGPSKASPGILKPDITGPGVSILAAWPFAVGPPSASAAGRSATYNIISGTSMSTPHLSGIAALLRAAHPNWSPAAIKSAMMTTADTLDRSDMPITDEQRRPATYFALGSGHVNPTKAVDPGLVYDLTSDDYVPYLCGLGYSSKQVQAITRVSASCTTASRIPEWDLNYPSISVILTSDSVTVKRTVKNVGAASSVFTAKVSNIPGVSVSVEPPTLQFSAVGEEKSYTVTLTGSGRGVSQGQLVWSSEKYVVRSPISITFD